MVDRVDKNQQQRWSATENSDRKGNPLRDRRFENGAEY